MQLKGETMSEQGNPIWLLETNTDKPWHIHRITIDLRTVIAIEEPSPYKLWQDGADITMRGIVYHVETSYQDAISRWRAALCN